MRALLVAAIVTACHSPAPAPVEYHCWLRPAVTCQRLLECELIADYEACAASMPESACIEAGYTNADACYEALQAPCEDLSPDPPPDCQL